ncbi:MAG: hypothetical protein ACLFS5_13605 [Spirochaetaceae bacterium]
MKARRKTVQLVGVVTAIAIGFAGCTNPFTSGAGGASGGDTGSIRIVGVSSGSMSTQTVFPDFDLSEVASYDVQLTDGPSGSGDQSAVVEADETGQIAGDGAMFEDLVPGEWSLQVEGYSDYDADNEESAGNKLVSGTETVTVERGTYKDITATVQLLDGDGEGSFAATLDWSEAETADDYEIAGVSGYSYTFTDLDDETTYDDTDGITTDLGDSTLTIADDALPAGTYMLEVKLTADNEPPYQTVARYSEVWYVYENVATEETITLTEDDFSYGGGAAISVSIDTLEDLENFFTELEESGVSEVASGEEFTISADVPEADGFTWYINGDTVDSLVTAEDTVNIEDGNGNVIGRLTGVSSADGQLSFTPEHGTDGEGNIDESTDFPAGVVILVTLLVEQDGNVYSGSHSVEVLEP